MSQENSQIPPEKEQTIEGHLRQLLSEYIQLKPEQIDPEVPLMDQGLDSFEFMRFIVDMEDLFRITVSNEDLITKPMDTLSELIILVETLKE
jgi:acyl carrier protein